MVLKWFRVGRIGSSASTNKSIRSNFSSNFRGLKIDQHVRSMDAGRLMLYVELVLKMSVRVAESVSKPSVLHFLFETMRYQVAAIKDCNRDQHFPSSS